jgi:hypothetical protein
MWLIKNKFKTIINSKLGVEGKKEETVPLDDNVV